MLGIVDRSKLAGRLLGWIWLGGRITRRAIVVACPVGVHLNTARLRSCIVARLGRPHEDARRNIEIVFAEDHEDEVRRIFREYIRFTESAYSWSMLLRHPGFNPTRYWEVQGLEHLRAAVDHGKGVILLTAHLGYTKLIPRIMEVHGFRARRIIAGEVASLREKKHRIEQWLSAGGRLRRDVYKKTQVYADSRCGDDIIASLDIRPILKALSDNQIVVVAGDGVRATGFLELSLLGQRYPFPVGFMKIAVMTGAVVLPTFAIPGRKNKSVRLEIGSPLAIGPDKTIEENVQTYATLLNDQLSSTPHLWQHWSRANWFANALDWSARISEDPFMATPPWSE